MKQFFQYYNSLFNLKSCHIYILTSHNIFSLQFRKSETFASTNSYVYSLDVDIYRNDGSILFADKIQLKTTNGQTTTAVASGFSYITGFKQLNTSYVAVVDYYSHCIRMVNREDNSNKPFAGSCGTKGYVDGASAKFKNPYDIELDERHPGHLLVTDRFNRALRSVDVTSGTVSTVIRTGFNSPRGLAWYNERLLVCNENYISEVSWSANGLVSNNKLTTTTSRGYRDGDFSIAQFNNPYEIKRIRDDLFLVADYGNSKLRRLNMSTRKVLPVCIDSSALCTTGTTLSNRPLSVLISDDKVYVGRINRILKLTGRFVNTISNENVIESEYILKY